MIHSKRQSDDIEITPEIVDAGVRAFYNEDDMPSYSSATVRDLVFAVVYAAIKEFQTCKKAHEVHK